MDVCVCVCVCASGLYWFVQWDHINMTILPFWPFGKCVSFNMVYNAIEKDGRGRNVIYQLGIISHYPNFQRYKYEVQTDRSSFCCAQKCFAIEMDFFPVVTYTACSCVRVYVCVCEFICVWTINNDKWGVLSYKFWLADYI